VVSITEINKVKKLTVSFAFICIILTIKFSEMIYITSRGFFCLIRSSSVLNDAKTFKTVMPASLRA